MELKKGNVFPTKAESLHRDLMFPGSDVVAVGAVPDRGAKGLGHRP
jgi:hypothetical protein